VSLSVQKLRGVINLLSDPLQVGNAAFILTREAKERGVLVADLILLVSSAPTSSAQTYRPPPPPPKPEPTAELTWSDVKPYDDRAKDGAVAWLPKSYVIKRNKDRKGRSYFSIPAWSSRGGANFELG
jgi:hypothetical protein